MAKKVQKLGIQLDISWIYYLHDRVVWRRRAYPTAKQEGAPPEQVVETSFKPNPQYSYFLDANGDISGAQLGQDPDQYVVWKSSCGPGVCVLQGPVNVKRDYDLDRAESRLREFPKDACYYMDKNHSRSTRLSDNHTDLKTIAVSARFKDFLAAQKLPSVEYLGPVLIRDPKEKVVHKDYWIVNPISAPDCLDRAKSKVSYNSMDKDDIDYVKQLIIQPKKIARALRVFRVKDLWAPLVTRELAAAALHQGFTGLRFEALEDYGS